MIRLKYPTHYVGITKGFRPIKYPTHSAIDLGWNAKFGGPHVPVYACGDGEVTSVRDGRNNTMVPGDSGNYVTVRYPGGYETRVCHLEKGSIRVVKGDTVTADTVLGKMGNSGYCGTSRGCHVHYIVWKDGKRVNPTKHTYVYPDETVAKSTQSEYPGLLYYEPGPTPEPTVQTTCVRVMAKHGVWARKGPGFGYQKVTALAYGAEAVLVEKDCKKANGYKWDKIEYEGVVLYMPNKWNAYFTREG